MTKQSCLPQSPVHCDDARILSDYAKSKDDQSFNNRHQSAKYNGWAGEMNNPFDSGQTIICPVKAVLNNQHSKNNRE